MNRTDLYLHEEFMLLALREDAGTVATSRSVEYPLAAALISELLLQERITLVPHGKKKEKQLVRLTDSHRLGEPVLDEAIRKISEEKDRKALTDWVRKLARIKDLKQRTALQLCRRGILRADEDKVLGIFTRKIYPEIDPGPERQLVGRLRGAIFGGQPEVKPRDSILIALGHQTHLLRTKFDQQDLKEHKERIKQIAEGNLAAKATKEVVDAVNAAIFVAVIMPATFS